ncbi:sensor histidine kinase [Enterococcus avium]|uniref:sensor histidine kinase n=1 Tax=Enterococcus malodoratus TaxID=71451 RepID=UPI0008D26E3F|nr:GHKL domain-containing protein [Enterococcus malodoratus]BBM17050.1 sensor histidine kinase [Enterococcus avium]SES94654.1 GHKL domain-containing protein [Enterococcus malodoratus]
MAFLENFVPVTILCTLNSGLLFSSFFPVKSWVPKRTLFLLIYLAVIPFYFINIFANNPDAGNLRPVLNLFSTLFFMICVQFFFKGRGYQKCLVAILFIVFTVISEGVLAFLARIVFPIDNMLNLIVESGVGNRIAMLINFLLIFSFWSVRKKRDISIQRNFSIIQLLIASICSLSLGILVISVMSTNQFLTKDYFLMGSFILLLGLFYLGFEMSDNLYKKNQEYQLQEQRHELLEEYYQQVEKHQQEVRKIKHDLKNQLCSIVGYLDMNNEQTANQQINDLIQQLDSSELPSFTQHTGVNALLRLHYQLIKQAGITCEFEIKCPETMNFSDADLSSLIGNILDNAREACEQCQKRKYIQLKMIYFNHSLVVSCENSTEGRVMSLATRKQDSANHGFGMKSIREIIEKHHGQLNYTSDDYSFNLSFNLFEQI